MYELWFLNFIEEKKHLRQWNIETILKDLNKFGLVS